MAEDAGEVAEEGAQEGAAAEVEAEVEAEEEPVAAEEVAAGAEESGGEIEVDIYAVLRYCIALVIQQAWVHLGLRAAQGATETKMDLPKAKVSIDTAAMLYEQVKPVAAEDEKRSVDTEMANLRINYARRAEQK